MVFTRRHGGVGADVAGAQVVVCDHVEAVLLGAVQAGEGALLAVCGAAGDREAARSHQLATVGHSARRGVPGRHHRVGGALHRRADVSGNTGS